MRRDPILNVGAVYLYDGATGALISTMTGSTAEDRVGGTADGFKGVVVRSSAWNNGAPWTPEWLLECVLESARPPALNQIRAYFFNSRKFLA